MVWFIFILYWLTKLYVFTYSFVIGEWLLYNVVLVSVVQWISCMYISKYSEWVSESHSAMSDDSLYSIQSMEFPRPQYWSGEPFPSPGDLPKPGIEPRSLALQADSLPAEPQGKPVSIVHIYPSLLDVPSTPTSHPSGSSQSTEPGSLCHAAASHWPPVLPTVVYICQCYLLNSSHPPHPHCGHMSILYVLVIYCFQWGNQHCAAVPKSQEPPWDESI